MQQKQIYSAILERNAESNTLTEVQKEKCIELLSKLVKTPEDEKLCDKIASNVISSIKEESFLIYIKKKNGALEEYDAKKIYVAIRKSADRSEREMTEQEQSMTVGYVEKKILQMNQNVIPVEKVHDLVIQGLREVRSDVAECYSNYHLKRKFWANMLEEIRKKLSNLLFLGDRSNSNSDSKLASTIQCLAAGYLGEEMYKEMLTPAEIQAMEDGYIYFHDKDKRYLYPYNCCLFNVENVLSGGFEMANIWYNEPKSLDVAFDVIGDIVLSSASQQYGGFTIPEIDKILEKYAQKTYDRSYKRYMEMGVSEEIAIRSAEEDVWKEMKQGFQGLEYKFNTVASSRGDYPFITLTFGLSRSKWGKMASIACLKVRQEGQGKEGFKKPVLFPKLVFLYDENLHGEGKELEDVFEAGISCSSKTMYPDWLSLTGEGYVAEMYKKYGAVISPMGCRAFLSPWFERGGMEPADENDKPVFVGRFNIGVISLNLPMIYQKSVFEEKDFYEVLDYYLEMIRKNHKRTFEYIGEMPTCRAPMQFCEGGLYGGNLSYTEKVKPLLKSATASFGVTALNELEQLHSKKSLVEDGSFSLEVMEYINNKIQEFKKEDQILYAVYGTPAESLCGRQVTQFRKKYGIVENVSDRAYMSNSFHCHVTEHISPIEKQNLEKRFWDLFNGGKIQYVKYNINYNREAIKTLIRRGMEMGFYEGANLDLSYCDDCGQQAYSDEEMGDECPVCGSKNLTKINRMNGYLSYSRVKGDTRLNSAKMVEIGERKSM